MLRSTERSRGTGPRATVISRLRVDSRGTGPRAAVKKNAFLHVGRGPVPRHARFIRGFRCGAESRGTGPRAAVKKTPSFTVGRGPVPRHARFIRRFRCGAVIAGDRPPRYGEKNAAFHRRARACPSPCSVYTEVLIQSLSRGGQAPALRYERSPGLAAPAAE